MSYCMITLVGNVGRDPEMRYTNAGKSVTNFSVACNRKYTAGDGESREETEWLNVTAWDKRAEFVNDYVVKGAKVFVQGRFSSRQYKARNGDMRTAMEVTALHVELMSGSRDDEPAQNRPEGVGADQDMAPDDLPW